MRSRKESLQYFGPDAHVFEFEIDGQTADDGVGDVGDAGLDGEKGFGETAVVDIVFEELDQVSGDGFAGLVFGVVGLGLIR